MQPRHLVKKAGRVGRVRSELLRSERVAHEACACDKSAPDLHSLKCQSSHGILMGYCAAMYHLYICNAIFVFPYVCLV